MDDGSAHETATAIRGTADPRVRTIRHETPQGVAASRNAGAAHAEGSWLAFVDDDDLWAPDKLSAQLLAAQGTGRSWAYAGAVNVAEDLSIVSGVPPPPPGTVERTIRRYNSVPGGGSNVIVRRDAFDRVGPFDIRLKNTEDWEMWIRLAQDGPPAWVPDPLLAYRVHGRNASLDVAAILDGVALIERRHSTRVDRGVIHRWIAESCLRTGRRRDALKHLAIAAANGQGTNVARDVAAIAERRLGAVTGRMRARRSTDDAWIGAARPWIEQLIREAERGHDRPPAGPSSGPSS